MIQTQRIRAFILGLVILPSVFFGSGIVSAQSEIQRLQQQISERNEQLANIEAEIAQYEEALTEVGAEKSTLQSAIDQLNLERQKVLADIRYTENRISNTDLEINKLTLEISDTEREINRNKDGIAEIIRSLNSIDNDSLIEILLRHEHLAEFWDEIESLETVKNSMNEHVIELKDLRDMLTGQKDSETDKRNELASLRNQYTGQQSVLEQNKAEKDQLLTQTENEEDQYQRLLEEKQEARDQLLAEVREIESQLQFILDPNSIPEPGTAVFRWPLDTVHLTQYFGYTKFALANPSVYKNNMHNGIDLGAPVGTKIYAPLTGTIRNIGNTDTVPGCYSWGKWILIDHPNGLSTLFAHLSHIGVASGQKVSTGDVVGYVGNTGYSTGPHLHYTLYVTAGVQVKQFSEFKAVTGCGPALSPFAAIEAYVDPLDYLP